MQKPDNSHATVSCRPCISTGVQFHTQQFESIHKLTLSHCCNIVYLQHGDVYI